METKISLLTEQRQEEMFPFISIICSNQLKKRNPDYFKILEALNIQKDSVINSNAKIAIRKKTQRVTKRKKQENNLGKKNYQAQKHYPITYRGVLRRRKWFRNFNGRQNSGRGEKLGVFRRMRNNCFS